ncbi:MAG TPA: ATP-binding protein [Dehalococcoidia bacterium]
MSSLRLRIPLAAASLVAAALALAALLDGAESLLIAGLVLGAVAGLLGVLASRSLLRPLASVKQAAAAIAAGDFGARVWPRPAGEVGELADAFNRMADAVQEQMTDASAQRGRLEAALNSSIDAVVALDGDLRVLYANVAAERLFQRPAAEVAGKPFVWYMPNEQVLDAVRASRDRGERHVNVIERPGRQYLQAVTTPIVGGGDWAVLVVFHDLTDVRRTELVRRDFVANVSHELRTPLAGLKSVIETLAAGAIEEPKLAHEFLDRADDEVDRLIQLVEELLELSRIESGEVPLVVAPADVAALLSDVAEHLRPQAERKGVSLSLRVGEDVGSADLDARRLERALSNLVHNAIKFTPEGGAVTVSAERAGDRLVVKVSDTGIGVAAEDLPRIFERFYKVDHSRASGGSGIGLAVVKHTVEAHGGSVKAESELGRGSTFSFSLPVARP